MGTTKVQGTDKEGVVHAIVAEGTTEIGELAFWACSSLASVTIPGSVTAIGDCAFLECSSLASVSLPAATTLGSDAFPSATVVTRKAAEDVATAEKGVPPEPEAEAGEVSVSTAYLSG